jgi:hypothetical protein
MTAVRVIGKEETPKPGPDAPPVSEPQPKAAPGPRPLIPPRAPQSSKKKTRVLFAADDGKISWKNMTPEARKQFEELFQDSEFLKQFGLKGDVSMMTAEQAESLYDAVGMIYSTVVRFLMKWPPEALKLLAYNDEQKKALAEPTAAVLNKFAPALLMQNKELLVWGSVFLMTTQANFLQAKAKAVEIFKQQAELKRLHGGAPENGKAVPVIPRIPAPIMHAPVIA